MPLNRRHSRTRTMPLKVLRSVKHRIACNRPPTTSPSPMTGRVHRARHRLRDKGRASKIRHSKVRYRGKGSKCKGRVMATVRHRDRHTDRVRGKGRATLKGMEVGKAALVKGE